jgi:hypothetical protein
MIEEEWVGTLTKYDATYVNGSPNPLAFDRRHQCNPAYTLRTPVGSRLGDRALGGFAALG